MKSLFVISSGDFWGSIMFVYVNSDFHAPSPGANAIPTYIFFVIFVFIGSLFFLGFFAGILFINFKTNKQALENPDLTHN